MKAYNSRAFRSVGPCVVNQTKNPRAKERFQVLETRAAQTRGFPETSSVRRACPTQRKFARIPAALPPEREAVAVLSVCGGLL